MKKRTILLLACFSLSPVVIYADDCCHHNPIGNNENSVTFTLGGGKIFFAPKRRIDNTGIGFGAIGYNFTSHWGIEALVGFFNTSFTGDFSSDQSLNGTLVLVDALYHFCPYRFVVPYAMAGVGVTGISPNRTDANNEGNINAGVGLQAFANNVVTFRIEARDIYTIVGGKNDVMLDAGLTFLLNL